MSVTLVTGAGGFIAGHLVRRLRLQTTGTIVGLDIRPVSSHHFDSWHSADLSDPAAIDPIIAQVLPDRIFHLAGSLRGSDQQLFDANVTSAGHLLAALRRYRPDARVVLMGSAAEYGVVPLSSQPVTEEFAGVATTPYGRTKQQLTALALKAAGEGQQVMVARPFNVLGPGAPDSLVAGAIASRLRTALAGAAPYGITIGKTSGIRDFVAVEDVAEGLIRMAEWGKRGQCYNLCTGEGRSVGELLQKLLAQTGETVLVEQDPELHRSGDVDQLIGSWEKGGRELGWRPTIGFDESIGSLWRNAEPTAS